MRKTMRLPEMRPSTPLTRMRVRRSRARSALAKVKAGSPAGVTLTVSARDYTLLAATVRNPPAISRRLSQAIEKYLAINVD